MEISTPEIDKSNRRCVYKLLFPDGSFYIGSTTNLRQRIGGYNTAFKHSIGSINKRLAAMADLFTTMTVEILCVVPETENTREYEQIWLNKFWGNSLLLNRSPSAYHNGGMIKSK